jgi:hypothetical protein
LKIGFKGNAPSSMKFGFNREEVSVIPMRQAPPGSGTTDQYASVLASINLNQTTGTDVTSTAVVPTQFFATGAAARNLAKRPDIRGVFGCQAQAAVQNAAADVTVAGMKQIDQSNKDAINGYFSQYPSTQFVAARDALLTNSGLTSNDTKIVEMKQLNTSSDFLSYLGKYPDIAATCEAYPRLLISKETQMIDCFTSCLQAQAATVQTYLQGLNPPHTIVATYGPFTEVDFRITDGVPTYCGSQPGSGPVMVIHSQV